jgi:SAM-dependent methyltransferase
MKYYTIVRGREHELLRRVELDGSILDVGGGAHAQYHELIKGEHIFHTMNINPKCRPDTLADIEQEFPFAGETFDHAICLNVLEHIYEFEHVVSETVRCIKPGGSFVIATPFMHHIHGSPDDYLRYTESVYRRLAGKFDCHVSMLEKLGAGFFSLGFQCLSIGGPKFLLPIARPVAVGLDHVLNTISNRYRKLTEILPLGYFVVLTKN